MAYSPILSGANTAGTSILAVECGLQHCKRCFGSMQRHTFVPPPLMVERAPCVAMAKRSHTNIGKLEQGRGMARGVPEGEAPNVSNLCHYPLQSQPTQPLSLQHCSSSTAGRGSRRPIDEQGA